jgi:hypothetical protein
MTNYKKMNNFNTNEIYKIHRNGFKGMDTVMEIYNFVTDFGH